MLTSWVFSLQAGAAEPVTVNFSDRSHVPLVKKFGYMNSGLVSQNRNLRDLDLLGYLNADSLRIDISNGKGNGWSADPVGGAQGSGNLTYSWNQLDQVGNLLQNAGALPYWSFSYIPDPLQQSNGAWRLPPNDYNKWQEASREFAAHFKAIGMPGYLEVYNEPDFADFWQGTRQEYFELYRHGALGFREGDPDAMIGGPSLAFTGSWINPFIDFVEDNDLPLDYFSFHAIGPKGATDNRDFAMNHLGQIRSRLNADDQFNATEAHLNEYNPFFPAGSNDTLLAQPQAATRLLDDYAYFLRQHDVTVVSWAQFMDSGSFDPLGLVDFNGVPKRAFFAAAMLGDLPIESYSLSTPNGISSLASADESRAGILMWNRSGSARDLDVLSSMLPFPNAKLKVYRVDQENIPQLGASPSEFLTPLSEMDIISGQPGSLWSGSIPNHGIVYLRIENLDAPEAISLPPGKVLRSHHYFPDRGTERFGYFDRDTWSAHLGLAGSSKSTMVGVTADEVASLVHIKVGIDRTTPEADGLGVAIRIDFRADQELVRTVLIHDNRLDGISSLLLASPWTDGKGVDAMYAVPDISEFDLDIASLAPVNWDGSAVFTFLLRDTFADTLADFQIERLTSPGDFNQDGEVDAADLQRWREQFGTTLDGGDFLTWQRNVGVGINQFNDAMMLVPEPGSITLSALHAAALMFSGGRIGFLFR